MSNEIVKREDFDIATIEAKVKAIVNAEIAAASTVAELNAVDVDGYATKFAMDLSAEKALLAEKIADIGRVEQLGHRPCGLKN